MDAPIDGTCDDRFTAVREEFARNFAERGEVGAGACVLLDGRIVVDLVGGWTSESREQRWQHGAKEITDPRARNKRGISTGRC